MSNTSSSLSSILLRMESGREKRWLLLFLYFLPVAFLSLPSQLAVLQNQTWVFWPTHSKANLLILGCSEEKYSIYCRAPNKENCQLLHRSIYPNHSQGSILKSNFGLWVARLWIFFWLVGGDISRVSIINLLVLIDLAYVTYLHIVQSAICILWESGFCKNNLRMCIRYCYQCPSGRNCDCSMTDLLFKLLLILPT